MSERERERERERARETGAEAGKARGRVALYINIIYYTCFRVYLLNASTTTGGDVMRALKTCSAF